MVYRHRGNLSTRPDMCETTDAFGMRDLLISRNIHHTWRISIKHFDIDKLPGDMLSKLKSPPKTANITSSQSLLVFAARKLSNTSLAWSRATPIYGYYMWFAIHMYVNLHHVPSHSCNLLDLVQSIVTRSRYKSYIWPGLPSLEMPWDASWQGSQYGGGAPCRSPRDRPWPRLLRRRSAFATKKASYSWMGRRGRPGSDNDSPP